MNKNILLALPISVLISACVAAQRTPPQHCKTLTYMTCNHGQIVANPTINVNTNAAANPVNPRIVCVNPGTTIKFKVTPTPATTTTVATVPKNPANAWMLASNSAASPDSFSFTVPDPLAVGNYDYIVVTGKGFCVDPRIRVPPGG